MTYEVQIEGTFTARHAIRLPDGTVEPAHVHEWHVTVGFTGTELDECGLLVDFDAVGADLQEVLAGFDHADLNRCPALRGLNPTAEYVAQVIFEALAEPGPARYRLQSVRVTEAPGCAAVCRRDESE